ncbi:MAG TPA: hydrogenase iron-sulfur subunit [Dissulfurispiraceae bacterium]|nr:hydrogenase iron-sulfur subunit [Dissulfurispiraceae bacterium]
MKGKRKTFEPRVVAFLCQWCSYAGADHAGMVREEYPSGILIVKVMCSGRVDPSHVLDAYRKGADGVMILACHPGVCHYRSGNLIAMKRYRLLVRTLQQAGIATERCMFDFVSATEGKRFAGLAKDMAVRLKRLGPLSLK